MSDVANHEMVKQQHPIRGLLWGLMSGVGLAVVLVLTKVIELDLVTMLIVVAIGMIVGLLWGLFGPAKQPPGPPPGPPATFHAPEPSRFDDFDGEGVDVRATDVGADAPSDEVGNDGD